MDRRAGTAPREAFRDALGAFALSRALVWGGAVVSLLVLGKAAGRGRDPHQVEAAEPFGDGWAGDVLSAIFSPLAHWDAVAYLTIADEGYDGDLPPTERRVAYFPLYPLAVRAAGGFAGSEAVLLVAAYVVSAAAFLGALYLLHRLVDLELGRAAAGATVALVAFSPWSLFFSAPYTESLFLLLSVGAFYAARTERWAWAGACLALASATRNIGILLIVPVALLYLWPRRRVGLDAGWLLLAPVGLALFSWHVDAVTGDPLGWIHAQEGEEGYNRSLDGPLAGLWEGAKAAVEAPWHLVAGGGPRDGLLYDTLPFLLVLLAGAAVVWLVRELHPAYGVYVALALVPTLSAPGDEIPLFGVPRFLTVLFPLFMALAVLVERRRVTRHVLAGSALLLSFLTATFATWHFVA